MNISSESISVMINEKLHYGESLISKLQEIRNTEGVTKLQRKIKQELDFLRRLQNSKNTVKVEQLSCSNLRHLGALVDCSLRPGVISVCKIFHIDENNKLIIDIISDEGKVWTKVIARNPKSLSALSLGKASYGARSILDQAKDYLECAQLYPCMYKPPKIVFEFVSGIEKNLAFKLKGLGVVVKGDIVSSSQKENLHEYESSDEDSLRETRQLEGLLLQDLPLSPNAEETRIDILNLDVTAMMAYVSNMTNGHCNYIFKQEVLTQQSAWESERPVKPILEKLFEGKTLVCCRTAWDDFEKIMNTLGGSMEKQRAMELREKLTIYDDDFGGCELCGFYS
ncbi:UPF0415 protein C7orf25 homolog isoform X2 [Leptidea sinapis]|uniref:UPF0415 protein C7orf25 homolog isoform X2 n=1 Tax=Leptidea sinapis TaxID=189913 RepID=UPI002136AD0C|nr:UPF0415 protein C7orf25 homolog isoform X2 [Leptidea sinapis]